jgi:hypothetical protein
MNEFEVRDRVDEIFRPEDEDLCAVAPGTMTDDLRLQRSRRTGLIRLEVGKRACDAQVALEQVQGHDSRPVVAVPPSTSRSRSGTEFR